MKRRTIFQALMAAIPLAFLGRKAEAEATYEFTGLSLDYSAYPCPECESFTLVYGPINQDIFKCDTCGATVSALDVLRGPRWQALDYPDDEFGIVRYTGYDPLAVGGLDHEPSPWWRNAIHELPHKNPDDPSWRRIR